MISVDADLHKMCNKLMHEMLWQAEPAAVEMFTFKKHMEEDPKYHDEEVGRYSTQKYAELKSSQWG